MVAEDLKIGIKYKFPTMGSYKYAPTLKYIKKLNDTQFAFISIDKILKITIHIQNVQFLREMK